jgi:hypothetical protein
LSTQPRRRRVRNNRARCRLRDSSQGDHDGAGVGLARLPVLEALGGAVVGKLSVARLHVGPSPLVLGERGAGLLLSPWVPQSRQPASALGGCHKAAAAPSSHRSLSSARPRRSLDQALVMASSLVVRVTPRATSSPDRTEHGLHRSGAHAGRWTYTMPDGKEKRPPVLGVPVKSRRSHRLSRSTVRQLL